MRGLSSTTSSNGDSLNLSNGLRGSPCRVAGLARRSSGSAEKAVGGPPRLMSWRG